MVLGALLPALAACAPRPAPPDSALSVLLVTVDTLRADALGAYGAAGDGTPVLDRLAAEGVLFESVTAQAPATGPSVASLMTSQYPPEHGVLHSTMPLAEGRHTLAEELAARGWRTAAFVSCSILRSRYGFAQGFDSYDETFTRGYADREVERDADEAVAAAGRWLERERRPFFVWLHLFDPHAPYRPLPGSAVDPEAGGYETLRALEEGRSLEAVAARLPAIRALYAEEVRRVDAAVGRLLERLRADGRLDRTLVILASDHGEELFDHGFFHGHFLSLSESVLRVPLVFRLPGTLPAGRRIEGPAQNIDVFPSVLSLLGLPRPAGLRGLDLAPAMRGSGRLPERPAWAQREPYDWMPGGAAFAVKAGGWKLVHFDEAAPRLYDLAADPGERRDLAPAEPARRRALERSLADWRAGGLARPPVRREELDPEDLETLRALGYVE